MTTMSATKARTMFYTLVNDMDEPVTITGKNGNKVLVSEDDWSAIEETLYLTSVPGFVQSIKQADLENDWTPGDDLEW